MNKRTLVLGSMLLVSTYHPIVTARAQSPMFQKPASAEYQRMIDVFGNPEFGTPLYDVALLPRIVDYLNSKDTDVVIYACELAAVYPSRRDAVPALLRLLSRENAQIRASAANSLHVIGLIDDSAIALVMKQLESEKCDAVFLPLARIAADYRKGNVDVVPHIVKRLSATRPINDEVKEELIRILASAPISQRTPVRQAAAKLLVDTMLQRAKGQSSTRLRYEAARCLGYIGCSSSTVVNALTAGLSDDGKVQLPVHRPRSMRVGPFREVTVAGAAAESLGRLGPRARSALEGLRRCLDLRRGTIHDRLQIAGAIALVDTESTDSIPLIIECVGRGRSTDLSVNDWRLRADAVSLLGRIGKRAEVALPLLQDILATELALIGEGQAGDEMAQLLRHTISRIRKGSMRSAGGTDAPPN